MNLLRAVSTVSAMTLLSRITGLARESLKAAVFGAGIQMDAFGPPSGCPISCVGSLPRERFPRRSSRSSPNIAGNTGLPTRKR